MYLLFTKMVILCYNISDMEEINLRDLFLYFKKHLILFFVTIFLIVGLGTAYTLMIQKPEYKAQATIILSSDKSKSTIQNEVNVNKNLIDTYTEVVKSHRVIDKVRTGMDLKESYEQLVRKISVSSLKGTEIISIAVVDRDKNHSHELANKIAGTFTEEIREIYNDKSVDILDRAVEPLKPYNIDILKQEVIYVAAGVILASSIIFLMFYFDRTIKTIEQIEQLLKLPIIGKVRKLETEQQKMRRKKQEERLAKKEARLAMKLEKKQRKQQKLQTKNTTVESLDQKYEVQEEVVEENNPEPTIEVEKKEEKPKVEIKAVGRKIIAEEKALQEKLIAEKALQEKLIAEATEDDLETNIETDKIDEEGSIDDSELVLRDNPKSRVSEDFRTIRTSLYFSLNTKSINSMLVTSSVPNEGKSFIASNLAIAFAKTQKKVLLIDCDMRLGRQHEIFNLSNVEGLSNFLAEHNGKKYTKYIQKTNIKNLSVMTRGVVPPNPSELLDSAEMSQLLEEVKQRYNYVILDGTPIDGLSDSLILAKKIDRTVLVCAVNTTTIEDLTNSKKAMEAIDVKISGVILNRTIDERRGNYYNKYYS